MVVVLCFPVISFFLCYFVSNFKQRVLVRFEQMSTSLLVNPETTSLDLAYSAANCLSEKIIPSTTLVIENYSSLGLERRIRRYEHVRDIMNSWDRDTQNSIVLLHSDTRDDDLQSTHVPKQPLAVMAWLYHKKSQGKWEKKKISLLGSGQIVISKKAGAKPAEKDSEGICHLSDADIYSISPQQYRKTLKPPKKYCYAIKSQQKSNVFLDASNFVHYFCTDDKAAADDWHKAVQEWRSWYLVNRKGAGQTTHDAGKTNVRLAGTRALIEGDSGVGDNPYTIGMFRPLLSSSEFDARGAGENEDEEDDWNRPRQIPFLLRNTMQLSKSPPPLTPDGPVAAQKLPRELGPPPVTLTRNLPGSGYMPQVEDDIFKTKGLLGRTYTQRQKAQRDRETIGENSNSPFVDGPSLLNGPFGQQPTANSGLPERTISTRRPPTSGQGLHRIPTTRSAMQPKPLLEFETPRFQEAPQWRGRRGRGVEAPKGVPLVDVAKSKDLQDLGGKEAASEELRRPAT